MSPVLTKPLFVGGNSRYHEEGKNTGQKSGILADQPTWLGKILCNSDVRGHRHSWSSSTPIARTFRSVVECITANAAILYCVSRPLSICIILHNLL